MCLVGATYLFEDNRKGLGEGVAGVCGEGWEGRFLSGCREKRCGHLLKGHPWPGAWAPREGGVTSQKVTLWPDGAPRLAEGPERHREEGSAEPFVCAVCAAPPPAHFPRPGGGRGSSLHIPSKCAQTAVTVKRLVPGLTQHAANCFCPHLFP